MKCSKFKVHCYFWHVQCGLAFHQLSLLSDIWADPSNHGGRSNSPSHLPGSNQGSQTTGRSSMNIFQPVRTARGQSSFKCPNCNRFYMRASCLKRHLRMECGKAPNYQCRICLGRFTYKHNLAAHMKLHVEEPNYHCVLCPKKFYRRDKLAEHEKKYHMLFTI